MESSSASNEASTMFGDTPTVNQRLPVAVAAFDQDARDVRPCRR